MADLYNLKKVKPFLSFITLFILLASVFAYAMFQGGFVSWFLFFSFFPFAIYSMLLFFYPLKFQAERGVSLHKYNAGDDIEVTLTLTRKLPFPLLFLLIEDVIPDTLGQQEGKRVFFPGFKRNLKMAYTIRNASRGEHFFNGVRLKTGDAFGILEKEKQLPCKQAILVYPPYEEVYYKAFRSMFDQRGTISVSASHNDHSLVAGIREYEPGDRFSWIDWKASAKSNELMSKEFETRESNDFMIILDREPAKNFEDLVKFAASVTRAIIRNSGKTGLWLPGKEGLFLPPHSGAAQEQAAFFHLAKVQPDGSQSFEKHFGDHTLVEQPAVIMIVTAALSKRLLAAAGKLLRQKTQIIICQVKGEGEVVTAEEAALQAAARKKGLIVNTIDGQNFQMVFAGVKQAR